MNITVLLNQNTRDSFLYGFKPGDELIEAFSYEVDNEPIDGVPYGLLENAYRCFNVGDDPAFGTPDPRAIEYRAKGHRSLSKGDVVVVGERAFACASFGWEELTD